MKYNNYGDSMNLFKKVFIRTYQKVLYLASFFLPFKEPLIVKGENSFNDLASKLKFYKKDNILLVSDKTLHNLKLDENLINSLEKENIKYTPYYDINPNPSINEVEQGVILYNQNNCNGIIAIGGGSVMDAAKVIGARVANKKTPINKMKGLLKIRKKLPMLIAIPTTAGTGSEVTVAAVISNKESKEKFPIEDCKLIPTLAILNPSLLINLPPHITSTTGMDALTHAIEAYIGKANTKNTKQAAIKAIQLIFNNLYESYVNPTNIIAREKMQVASYFAGVAFTRAYVGYVHALAHTLGGQYNVPHGLANAIILPIVLKEYGDSVTNKLAELYDYVIVNSPLSKKEKANKFIEMIEELNNKMNIKNNFKEIIKDEDIDSLAKKAYKEAIPLYPTPTLWDLNKFKEMYYKIKK